MQKRESVWRWVSLRSSLVATGLVLALAGCASMQQAAEKSNQQLLEEAGFTVKVAETPAQESNLKKLTQLKLTIQEKNGEKRFVYADAEGCNCVYVGTPEAFKKLSTMVDQKIAEQRGMAASENMNEAMYWEDWPPGNW